MFRLQSALPFIGILLWLQRISTWSTPQQYHLISLSMTWYEAQQFCRVKHSDLATVSNMDDKNRLDNTLDVTYAWIGLRKGNTARWMWSDGSGMATFTKWAEGEPNNDDGHEGCTEISQNTEWNDLDCETKWKFVCFDRLQDGTKKFVHYKDGLTWTDSVEWCRDKHTDLAKIETNAENSEIVNLIKSWTGLIGLPKEAWIGLFRDNWMWSDRTETSFRYWLKGSVSSGNCVAASAVQQGGWIQSQCERKSPFICQGALKVKKMVIRMKVDSDVALDNITLNNTLLLKLDTKLRLQKIDDFKLSWRKDTDGVIFHRVEEPVVKKKGC